MLSYIESLHKRVEQEQKERELAKKKEAASVPPVKPLEQQLIEYFRAQSPSQAKQPFQMSDLILHLQGQYRQNPHPQMVSVELRKLGYERRRLYGSEFGGKRYWFPPT